MNTENIWFQQDGASIHAARGKIFNGKLILRFGNSQWPARSDIAATNYRLRISKRQRLQSRKDYKQFKNCKQTVD